MTSTNNNNDFQKISQQESFNSEDSFSLSNFKVSFLERKVPIILTILVFISIALIGVTFFALYLALLRYGNISTSKLTEVEIKCGIIRGIERNGIIEFLGIPYALPPVGVLQFQKPVELTTDALCNEAWKITPSAPTKLLFASKYRSMCMQLVPVSDDIIGNEDCLYVNVFSPPHKSWVELKPVVVVIGGFFFSYGGTSMDSVFDQQPDPRTILDVNAIHVTFSYRLGPLGFLTHPSTRIANIGIRDQIAVLRWIQQNIKAFGGDPVKITLFAYGSGATTSLSLLGAPFAQNLFEKVWMSSPAIVAPSITLTQALDESSKLFGCETSTNCLHKLSGDQITRFWNWSIVEPWIKYNMFGLSTKPICLTGLPCSGGILVIDNEIIRIQSWGKPIFPIPIVFGQNSHETATYTTPETVRFWTSSTMNSYFRKYFDHTFFKIINDFYNLTSKNSFNGPPSELRNKSYISDIENTFSKIVTDIRVTCPLHTFIQSISLNQPIYRYYVYSNITLFDPYDLESYVTMAFHGWDAFVYLRSYLKHIDYRYATSKQLHYMEHTESVMFCQMFKEFIWNGKISNWTDYIQDNTINVLKNGSITTSSIDDLAMCKSWNKELTITPLKFAWKA